MKPFRVIILQYAEHIREIHDLANYLPPPSMKGMSFESTSWDIRDKLFSDNYICIATKDRLSTYMQDELEDNHE